MMHEYIITLFKVVVAMVTNERLVYAALIGFGILLLWVIFSLCFSFQMRFISASRKINKHVSRKGLESSSRGELKKLVAKMPSEFVRGFNTYEMDMHALPSQYIKRSDSLDLELTGGVFNQNKSILKSYINMIFALLAVFSFAIMSTTSSGQNVASDSSLTGYMLAEAMLVPLLFMIAARLTYYIYTAIRQHQYNVAVEEFNELIDNLDKAAMDAYGYKPEPLPRKLLFSAGADVKEPAPSVQASKIEPTAVEVYEEKQIEAEPQASEAAQAETLATFTEEESSVKTEASEPAPRKTLVEEILQEEGAQEEFVEIAPEVEEPAVIVREEALTKEELSEPQNVIVAEGEGQQQSQELESEMPEPSIGEEPLTQSEIKDNFKPNFASLLEEERRAEEKVEQTAEVKRGRGRPKKEVSEGTGLVIKTDKEFEEALLRAEKLMRKNEEPLSSSQTKRIEKQLKELIDAMTKFKEGK